MAKNIRHVETKKAFWKVGCHGQRSVAVDNRSILYSVSYKKRMISRNQEIKLTSPPLSATGLSYPSCFHLFLIGTYVANHTSHHLAPEAVDHLKIPRASSSSYCTCKTRARVLVLQCFPRV